MASIENSFVFVSILFIIVVNLSDKVYKIDIYTITKNDNAYFGIPNLGRFTIIYLVNSFILLFSYYIVMSTVFSNNDLRLIFLLTIIGVMYSILPILQSNNYDILMTSDNYPNSFILHIKFSIVLLIFIPIYIIIIKYFGDLHQNGNLNKYNNGITTIFFLMYYYWDVRVFLKIFKKELKEEQLPKNNRSFQ